MDTSYSISAWDGIVDPIDIILPILREYLGSDLSKQWLEYKLKSAASPSFAALASMDGKVVGIAASSVQPFTASGMSILGALSVVTFVHPDHRGKGLYPKLLAELAIQAEELGVAFQVALPNVGAQKSFSKAGYELVGESREQITLLGKLSAPRAILSVRHLANFAPSSSCHLDVDESRLIFETANDASPFIQSRLTSDFLRFRLSEHRNYHYTTDTFEDMSVILMHGRRGRIREARILSTAPRVLTRADQITLRTKIHNKYGADLVSERSTTIEACSLAFDAHSITRRANPPVYILTTKVAPEIFNPRSVKLTGIDTHTW